MSGKGGNGSSSEPINEPLNEPLNYSNIQIKTTYDAIKSHPGSGRDTIFPFYGTGKLNDLIRQSLKKAGINRVITIVNPGPNSPSSTPSATSPAHIWPAAPSSATWTSPSPHSAPRTGNPSPTKHFEDRLFDRDTLLLREYQINLIFLIAAYGAYEDCWTTTLRTSIREDTIQLLNDTYRFFKIEPADIPLYSQNGLVGNLPFTHYFRLILEGKAYKEDKNSKELILAFKKNKAPSATATTKPSAKRLRAMSRAAASRTRWSRKLKNNTDLLAQLHRFCVYLQVNRTFEFNYERF